MTRRATAPGETVGTSSTSYVTSASHNHLNQLTGVSGGGPVRFAGSLDELGTVTVDGNDALMDSLTTNFVGHAQAVAGTNVITVTATDYSGNARTNQYQLVVTNNGLVKTLLYDLNGNLTNAVTATTTNSYDWDAADRLVAVESGTGVSPVTRSEFTYDGLSRLAQIIEKTNGVAISTNWFVWCGLERCEERDSTGGTATKRFFGQGQQIGGTNYFVTRDHLGSVREMTDGSGAIRARYGYDPYGRVTQVSGELASDFRYTGHYYHATSGLHLAPFRAYDAETGRWISRDPIQENGGLNLYAYVGNDPLNRVDPTGLVWNPWAWHWHHDIPQRFEKELKRWGSQLNIHAHEHGTMLQGTDHIGRDGIYNVNGKAFDRRWYKFMSSPKSDAEIVAFKNAMKGEFNSLYPNAEAATEGFIERGARLRASKALGALGIVGAALGAAASAQAIGSYLQDYACDKMQGKDDWAYVDVLMVRQELNQHGFFAGDIAMRGMLGW